MIYSSLSLALCSRLNFMRWIGLFVIVLITTIWKQDYLSSAPYTVLALVYIGNTNYDFVPSSSFGSILQDDIQYKVRLQFLFNEPNLCNRTNVVVVDDFYNIDTNLTNATTTVATNTSNTTTSIAIYRKPSPISHQKLYGNGTSAYREEYIPVALLAVNDEACTLSQKINNAQAIHPSVEVLFVSGTYPGALYPDAINDYSGYIDTRLFVFSITNQTGKAFRKHLIQANQANGNITKQGGPIITFDSVGTRYDYPAPVASPPFYYYDDESNESGLYIFLFVCIAIGGIIFVCTVVRRANLASNTANNVSATITPNNVANNTSPSITRTGTSQPEQPQQQRQVNRLLTEAEVQQFLSTVAPSRVSANNEAKMTSNNSILGKFPSLVRMSLSKLDGTAADNKDDEDYCSICLMEINCCNNENINKSSQSLIHNSGNIFNDEINNNSNSERDSTRDIAIARLPCLHVFHMKCIVPWLTQRQGQCPLCKFDVAEYITNTDMNPSIDVAVATVVDDTNEVLTVPTTTTSVEREYDA